MVTVGYDFSDPLGSTDWVTPAPGAARLWAVRNQARNALPIDKGGDLVPPGVYTMDELGLGPQDGTVALWFELVQPSSAPGDVQLTATIGAASAACNGDGAAASSHDTVLLTGVQIRLVGRGLGDTEWFERDMLIGTTLIDPEDEMPAGYLPGAWQTYKVRIFDPRDGFTSVYVAGTALPLTPMSGGIGYESPEFICLPPAAEIPEGATIPAYPIATLTDGFTTIEYNSQQSTLSKKQLKQMQQGDKLLTEVDTIVEQMRADGWEPPPPQAGQNPDPGAFGKEVHKRATAALHGKPGIAMDVWVHNDTKQVLHIGPSQPSGFPTQGTTQIDAVVILDKNYTLQVGQTYDVNKCVAREIKMSIDNVTNSVIGPQLEKLNDWSANGEARLVRARSHWKPSTGWTSNPKFLNTKKALMIAGAVSTSAAAASADWIAPVHALVVSAQQDEQIEQISLAYKKVKAASSESDRNIHAQDALDLTKQYIMQFFPDQAQGAMHFLLYSKTIEIMCGDYD